MLECISGVKLQFVKFPIQSMLPREYQFHSCARQLLQIEVDKLVMKGVVTKIPYDPSLFVSNIFSRPKPNGSIRLIIDLTELNNHLVKEHFKMDHIEVAINMVSQGSFMASIDLRDAYYSVPLHNSTKPFICFIWKGEIFQFNCVPFGLSPAPRIFTKILKPIFSEFRKQGGHGFSYIDDSFIWGKSNVDCLKSVEFLLLGLQKLGFTINTEKSTLVPKQVMKFLGFIIDTEKMEVRPTPEKIVALRQKIEKFIFSDSRWFKIRDVASLLGTLVDISKGVDYGLAHYKNLERDKIWGLIKQNQNLNKPMKISRKGLANLHWWWNNIQTRTRLIRPITPSWEITTDASLEGWGAVCSRGRTGGRWTALEAQNHINVLELSAVLLGLKSFFSDIECCTIAVRSDNTTSVAYINKMGGTKSVSCNNVTSQIWEWAEQKNVWITASYIPGVLNVEADFESRHFSHNTEWKLNTKIFSQIVDTWGLPSIDLFASRLNHQLDNYASWYPDPGSAYVDAFSFSWGQFDLVYLFPPFSLLGRCLRKIKEEDVRAIVVAPDWGGQSWYTTLVEEASDLFTVSGEENLLPLLPGQDDRLRNCPLVISLFSPRKCNR